MPEPVPFPLRPDAPRISDAPTTIPSETLDRITNGPPPENIEPEIVTYSQQEEWNPAAPWADDLTDLASWATQRALEQGYLPQISEAEYEVLFVLISTPDRFRLCVEFPAVEVPDEEITDLLAVRNLPIRYRGPVPADRIDTEDREAVRNWRPGYLVRLDEAAKS